MNILNNGKSLPCLSNKSFKLNKRTLCERFEFTIHAGYEVTKNSVSKITVVIEGKRVKKCVENLFINCVWY